MKTDRSSSRGWAAQVRALVVAAVSLIGACSAVSPERDGSPETPMTPVLSSMATHATSATVGWTLPRTTLEVLRFELRWRPSTENAWPDDVVNIPSTEPSHTITGLAPDTEYAVQVRAVFASSGEGPWSLSVMPRTEPEPGTGTEPTVTIENRFAEITEAANGMQFFLNASPASTADLAIIVRVTETGGPRLLRPGTLQIERSGSFEQFVDLGMNQISNGCRSQIDESGGTTIHRVDLIGDRDFGSIGCRE